MESTPLQTLLINAVVSYTDPIKYPPKKWKVNEIKRNWKGEPYYGPKTKYGTHGEHVRQIWSELREGDLGVYEVLKFPEDRWRT